MSQRIVVAQQQPARHQPSGASFFVVFLVALIVGGITGWNLKARAENVEELRFHSAQLRPWLAYDPEFWKMRARSLNDDHRRVAFLVYQAYADRCDLEAVLDAAMPESQVPPALKALTAARLLENHEQCLEYGLYTEENLHKMALGRAP